MKASSKFIVWVFLMVGLVHYTHAQDYVFKVIASSGSTHKNSVKEEQKLKIGGKLAAGDKVVVGASSYVGLSYSQGGTAQISIAGTYSVKDLETKLLASQKSVGQKYASFIIGEMTKAGGNDIHKNPYKYQNVTGSVERDVKFNANEIVVLLPKQTSFLVNEYLVKWNKVNEVAEYAILIRNNFGEDVKKFNTADTSFVLKLDDKGLLESDQAILTVTPVGKKIAEPKEYSFNRLDKKDLEHFQKKFNHFKNHEKINEEDAHSILNMAVYLEEHGMILDATVAYEKAMNLAKGDEVFEIAYKQFLIRQGIAKSSQFVEEEARKGEEK
ncbi:MAG: hypothetical protein MUE85_16785 [Microscillaceae bacterium]|jgi:hypothetical protein|nr:hypothetical protein [Microscillaceae bacterium]